MIGEDLHPKKLKKLELIANYIRQDIIKALLEAGSGHSAGPLGMADIFTALYFHVMNVDPKKPKMADRDRLVLSCGHINPVWYAALARRGYFSRKEFTTTLRKLNTRMLGHPHNLATPGVENSGGPLGQGLSQAIGMALAAKMDKKNIQIDGFTEDVMPLEPLRAKYEAFNWHVIEIDGNNIRQVVEACNQA